MQKNNIDAYLSQYEDLLGEKLDLDEPEEGQVELDPEIMALQKQLNKNKNTDMDNIMSQYKGNDIKIDDDLKIKQPQIQKQTKQDPTNDPISIENSITNPQEFSSLYLLKHEISYIKDNILPQMKKNKQMNQLYTHLISQMETQLDSVKQSISRERVQEADYMNNVNSNFKAQETLYKQQNGIMKQRVGLRCQCLFNEMKRLKAGEFDAITQEFGCAADVGTKFLIQEFDQKPHLLKAEELLRRHKQYLNMAQYYSQNFKGEKDINPLISKLEISKQFIEQFKSGENPQIGKFLFKEIPELTQDIFRGCNNVEYQAKLQMYLDQTKQAQKEENLYYKVALTAKPTLQRVAGQKQMVAVSPADVSKQNLSRYEQMLKYLNELSKIDWTPLPQIQISSEQRQLSIDNKDVEKDKLRVQFKKLNQNDKYYIIYTLDLNCGVYQQKTHVCQQGNFNYSEDINLGQDKKNAFKDLQQKKIDIKLYKKGFFSDDLKGKGIINFEGFLDMSTLEGEVTLDPQKGIMLEYIIQLRESLNKKKSITVVQMGKIYPQFDMNNGVSAYIDQKIKEIPNQIKNTSNTNQSTSNTSNQNKTQQQQQQIPEQQEEEEAPSLVDKNKLVIILHIDANEEYQRVKQYHDAHPEEDIINPEDPVKGQVYFFIDPYEGFLKNKIVEFRQDPTMRQQVRFLQNLWDNYLRQKIKITQMLEDGTDIYLEGLMKSISRDKKLLSIYAQLQAPTWSSFVKQRLEVSLKEEEELKSA